MKNLFKNLKSNKKAIVFLIIIGIILCLSFVISIIFALLNINNTNIMKGVYLNEVDLSGMSQTEAKDKIEALINEKLNKEISISYKDYNSTINATILEVNYDFNPALEEAYSVGRAGNLFTNNYQILSSILFGKKININITLNDETTKTVISDISAKLPDALVQSSYYIEEENLIVTKGKIGTVIDEEQFKNNIKNWYSDLALTITDVNIPVIEKEPDGIDIDKIHEDIYKEAKDAYYNEQPFEIYPEVDGVDFDIEEAKKLLETDSEEYTIKLIITKPKITINDLSEIAFKDVLGTFSTKFDVSNVDRTTNLKLAAKKINGTIIAAGEEFSYNKIVGERTIAAGYKEAKVYSNGEVVDGLGGGICQISSTLYNAAVLANLDITQRRNHQFVTSYVSAGRDATVVYGAQDFKFKNSRKYPVKIELTVNNGIAKATVYGIKENPEYEVSIQTKTISTIPFSTTYKEDDNMDAGEEKVERNGANGLVTETYKVVTNNGSVVSRTLLSKDVYNAMEKIIVRGTSQGETDNSSSTVTVVESTSPVEEIENKEEEKPIEEPESENTVTE